jgi:hypothetical protein
MKDPMNQERRLEDAKQKDPGMVLEMFLAKKHLKEAKEYAVQFDEKVILKTEDS